MDYCRQMQEQYTRLLNYIDMRNDLIPDFFIERLQRTIDDLEGSVKFVLPEGGLFIEDMNLKGLDGGYLILNLPFETIALEYSHPDGDSPKRIIVASEAGDSLVIGRGFWSIEENMWVIPGRVAINKSNYVSMEVKDEKGWPAIGIIDLRPPEDNEIPLVTFLSEAAGDVFVLLSFLNALSCSNVEYRSVPKLAAKSSKWTALPENEYHELVIKLNHNPDGKDKTIRFGGHRSPREHLRRGHIRNLSSGTRIWINSTIVGKNNEGGRIEKSYRIKSSSNKASKESK